MVYVTVTPAPTPTPVVTPTVAPTVTPTAVPTASPTVAPTATPDPVHTVIPASPIITTAVQYRDVSNDAWFYRDMQFAVRSDLIDGTGRNTFSPAADLTVAEAVELVSRLHQYLNQGEVTLKDGFWLWWYKPYRTYALEQELIDQSIAGLKRKAMNAPISNGDFAKLLGNVLPAEDLSPINSIPNNSIPDVKDFSPNAEVVYLLYRAGIFTGVTEQKGLDDHSFLAHESPSRAEAAVYAARMAEPDRRVEFIIE